MPSLSIISFVVRTSFPSTFTSLFANVFSLAGLFVLTAVFLLSPDTSIPPDTSFPTVFLALSVIPLPKGFSRFILSPFVNEASDSIPQTGIFSSICAFFNVKRIVSRINSINLLLSPGLPILYVSSLYSCILL